MTTTWIVTADAARARVLQAVDQKSKFTEVEDFLNPEARMSGRELTEDAQPRFRGTAGPGSDRQETSAEEHATELFAKRVAERLNKARMEHRYDELKLVAEPQFLGQLRKALDREVEKLVTKEVAKDYSGLDLRELERRLEDL